MPLRIDIIRCNIAESFVETNCYWCANDEATREKHQELKHAGLRGILISVNPFYLEYVPFERTERGIRISREVFGDNVMIYQLEYYSRFRRLGIKGRLPVEDYQKLQTEDLITNVELFPMGRAAYALGHLYPRYPADCFLGNYSELS